MIYHRVLFCISITSLAALAWLALSLGTAYADPLGTVTSYLLPTSGAGPYAIAEGPDGNLWFTEQTGNKVGRITPSGTITEYSLAQSNSYPADIVSGPGGALWFTSSNGGYVGKITTSGVVTQYSLPSGAQPLGITVGPDGDLWIAGYTGYPSGQIYRMSDNGSYKTYTLNHSDTMPSFIVSDPVHDEVWVGERDHNLNGWITKISMDGSETDYALPTQTTGIQTLTQGSDGDIYFVYGDSTSHDYIGKIDDSGVMTTADLGSGHGLWYIREGLDGSLWATDGTGEVYKIDSSLNTSLVASGLSYPIGLASGSDGNMWVAQFSGNKITKIGEGTITPIDQDGDGLTAAQELEQGTSDLVADTDHDGLSDYTESQWNTNRNAEFCNTAGNNCAYPDPLKRNIYIEMDWMVDPNGVSYKPSTLQMITIQSAFANHGIDFRYDTGSFDGGNQVPYNKTIYWSSADGHPSFLDYKNGGNGIPAEFDSATRGGIWHYMLFGYSFAEAPDRSGVSTAGTPNSFVSYGYIKANPSGFGYSDFDTAISGTILHELGHTLCLTQNSAYVGQNPNCVFAGIDNNSYSSYHSAMNYLYQMSMVDYSSGQNGSTNDHDDWGGFISGGL